MLNCKRLHNNLLFSYCNLIIITLATIFKSFLIFSHYLHTGEVALSVNQTEMIPMFFYTPPPSMFWQLQLTEKPSLPYKKSLYVTKHYIAIDVTFLYLTQWRSCCSLCVHIFWHNGTLGRNLEHSVNLCAYILT